MVIVDEYSRFVQAVPMVHNSEASPNFLAFVKWFGRNTGQPIQSFYKDGGLEFSKCKLRLEDKCVDVDGSTAYTLASNGQAKRNVGIILQSFGAALFQAQLPVTYWDYAVMHVAWCKKWFYTAGRTIHRSKRPWHTNSQKYIMSGRSGAVYCITQCLKDFRLSSRAFNKEYTSVIPVLVSTKS